MTINLRAGSEAERGTVLYSTAGEMAGGLEVKLRTVARVTREKGGDGVGKIL
jgi:hypothetical protein